jgi:CRISPR-associated protein Cmr1
MIQQTRLKLQTLSPAFLGDAQQSAVWRTPPIKALLREWWRVAAAPTHGHDHQRLRLTEGKLFGNAWLDNDFCKSQVRMALEHWHAGKLAWDATDPKVTHQEVKDKNTGQLRQVGSQLYLGYGPLTFQQGGTHRANATLQSGDTNTLDLAWPGEHDALLRHTLQLIDWFGTFGGRSRNGWGSLALGREALTAQSPHLQSVLRPLAECLHLDWPHALGKDSQGPLIWESSEIFSGWQNAMRFLAQTKIGFRTHLKLVGGQPHQQPQERHLLAYPVTHHKVSARSWGGDGRLANQLRFKLFHDSAGHLRARLYHTPHKSPLPTSMSEAQEGAVWQKIHTWLDQKNQKSNLQRLGATS